LHFVDIEIVELPKVGDKRYNSSSLIGEFTLIGNKGIISNASPLVERSHCVHYINNGLLVVTIRSQFYSPV